MNENRRTLMLQIMAGGVSLNSGVINFSFAQSPKNSEGNFSDKKLQDPSTGRTIGIRIRLPEKKQASGLILYSPGLGSGLSNGEHWCNTWQASGFVVVTLSHPVTNEDIWNIEKSSFKTNLNASLAAPQYSLRVNDCKFVLNACLKNLGIESYIDPQRIGIAGHSYGALTVQSIAGQLGNKDTRIKAAIALSPGAISKDRAKSMKHVGIPFMCVTGQQDNSVTFKHGSESMKLGVPLANRLAIYEHLPQGKKYLLNLSQADHMSFAGEPIDGNHFSRDIEVSDISTLKTWKKVSHVTTVFWNHHLNMGQENKEALKKIMASGIEAKDILELG
jgi:predicted dienelactone hydrolase